MSNQQYSYRPNMTRNVTRKWAEARQVDYGGDDWGEDPSSSYEEPVQQPLSHDRRAQTNPAAFNSFQRTSFDQGDERRNPHAASDSSSSAGFPAFNNAQPAAGRFYGNQPAYAPPSRQQTMPVQGVHPNRDLHPPMPAAVDSVLRDTTRSDSRDSNAASRSFPPRKSSLGQSDLPSHTEPTAVSSTIPVGDTSKPLPFVRPVDIYARMEEEKEKERRSQDSARPSMDSLQRDTPTGATNVLQSTAADTDVARRRQPTLDTVAERKSEYGLENMIDTAALKGAGSSSVQPINTSIPQQSSYPSASSKYTDRADPISATTEESRSPVRNTTQQARNAGITSSSIPPRNQGSTFESASAPAVPPKDNPIGTPNNSTNLQHQPSLGYKTMVKDVFDAENQKGISPTVSQESMLRSNTTSTSEISPIVERMREQPWKQPPKQTPITEEQGGESFSAPRRMGTNRRESPSPARRPLSIVSPDIPEPRSALPMEDNINTPITKDTATKAQIMRPGPAILVHQQPRSREYIHNQDPSISTQAGLTSLRKQGSQTSSDQRSASEEWQEWSAARREFNAKHGIKDSNPTTPGPEFIDTSSDPLAMEASGNTSRMTKENRPQEIDMPVIPTTTNLHPVSRPDMSRDESFRPVLPGGWQSSEHVPQTTDSLASAISPSSNVPKTTGLAASVFSPPRPAVMNENNRTDSLDSIPTATAPRRENWRSEPQAQAFANARNAGSALAGIFPTPRPMSTADDSEVSSINEHEEGPTGRHREAASAARDFAASPPGDSTTAPKQSSAHNFAKTAVGVPEGPTTTMRGRSVDDKSSFDTSTGSASGLPRQPPSTGRDESPAKESERWWSDDEDTHPTNTDVPAPLRTPQRDNRTREPRDHTHPLVAPDEPKGDMNHNQLETDIVKSLTPKSSSIHPPVMFDQRAQAHNTRGIDETGSRSPPFAAAALALSPSRGSQSLEEQNTFKPLQAPQRQTNLEKSDQLSPDDAVHLPRSIIGGQGSTDATQLEQPGIQTSSQPLTGQRGGLAKSIVAGEAARVAADDLGHQHGHHEHGHHQAVSDDLGRQHGHHGYGDHPHGHHQAASNVTSQSKPLPPDPISTQQPPGPVSARQKPESPALARLNSSAKKEFTIMSDEPFTPSPITQTKAAHGESSWPVTSPNTTSQATRDSPVETVAKSYPARATANAAVTLPSPTNKGSDLAPVHEEAIEQALSEAEPATTETQPEADESRSVKTTATTVRPSHESPRPGTVASASTARPSTPTSRLAAPTSGSTSTGVTPQTTKTAALAHPYDPNAAFPFDKVPVSQIIGMKNAHQRINAYNENRDVYIQPVGHLESWLSSMNTPEHADIFSGQRPVAVQNPTPSPRVSTGRASVSTSGTRQMQEDGRRLLEGAKKYGGKAGVLGKGFFSKGKEKLRTVSASNKGSRKAPPVTESSQTSSTSAFGSAPQLPTPSQTTPIDEELVSQYFASHHANQETGVFSARGTERSAMQPPFTPISEVSTRDTSNLETPYRPVSGVSLDQTPRAQHTGKRTDTTDKRKSAAAISAIGSERDGGRFSTEMLNPSGDEDRRNSSVSDVSSVSDNHARRQSMAARTVSPPIEQQTTRNIPPYSAMTMLSGADVPSPMSTTKQAEAEEDRVEESTLPRYTQTTAKAPKIAPGTQVLPVTQLGDNQEARDGQQRPFSFVGNDSLLHTGEQRQHTIDSPDATLRGTVRHSHATPVTANQPAKASAIVSTPTNVDRVQSESPLPSARRPPEELAKLRQNAAPYVPQHEEGAYRIPGPYTRELRSPKPKTHSPTKEQSQVEYPRTSSPSVALDPPATAATTAALGSAQMGQPNTAYRSNVDNEKQQEPQHQQLYLQQQFDSATPDAANIGKDRNRKGSRLGGFFGTRTKSPTRNPNDRPRLEPDNRRNSLFKIGSRNSMSSRGGESEQNDEGAGQKARPITGPRRLSKDLLKTTTFSQQQAGQANYGHGPTYNQMEPLSAPPTKKKRFSGLFARTSSRDHSQMQAPTRASTLPLPMDPSQEQSQDFYGQHPDDQQRYSSAEPGQPFQGRQPPPENYYGQPNENHRQMHLSNTHNQLTGQAPQQHEHTNSQSFGHRQFYDPGSSQHQQSPHPYATPISGLQDQSQVSGPNVPQGQGPNRFEPRQQSIYDQHHPEQRPDLRLDTGDRQAGFVAASAPPVPQDYLRSRQRDASQTTPVTAIPGHQQTQPPVPQTRANRDISYGSEFRGALANQSPASASNITPRVQALHMRSRSPKLGRPTSEDLTDEINALAPSPANDLGTFSNKRVSPAGGIPRSPEEQEKPWTIGLPGEEGTVETDHGNATNNSRAREIRRIMLERAGANKGNNGFSTDVTSDPNRPQTVAERFMGHSMPPPKGQARAVQTPTSTSTSTAAGKVPSPKASLTNVTINRNPSLRGKGPTLSRSGTPVASNADLARTVAEQRSSTFHDGGNIAEVPPVPTPRAGHLSESQTGERNENYPANAITALANQNRMNVGKKQEPLSASTKLNESAGGISGQTNDMSNREAQQSPVLPRGQENGNTIRDLALQEASKRESAYEARSSLANAPTPPPPEPKRRPPVTSKSIEIHELVGSRPEGYESDDEPLMSATAWPGQEWQPVFDMSED